MITGNEHGKGWCIRAKLNMQDPVKCLRDPVLYRSNPTKHHRTGTRYHCYPTYDFACPIVDSLEGVTHSLRTIEYKDRDALYMWVQKRLELRPSILFEFSKLNFKYCLMSKRKLQELVNAGDAQGWNDPRFPTVQGIIRRGMTVEALKQFMLEQGASKNTNLMEWDKIWAFNKSIIDPIAKRFNAICNDTKSTLHLENGPSAAQGITVSNHPKNAELGKKAKIFTSDLLVESADMDGLKVGEKFTLRELGNAFVTSIKANGEDFVVSATLAVDDKEYKGTRKVCWVAADPQLHTEVQCEEYSHFLTKESLKKEDNVEDFIDTKSMHLTTYVAEKDVDFLQKGDYIQIERRGFFRVDKDHVHDNHVSLIFVPDGKAKNISTLAPKVSAKDQAATKIAAKAKEEGEEETPPEGLTEAQIKNWHKKQAKKAAKKLKKAGHKKDAQ